MHWFGLLMLAYLAVAIQAGLAGQIGIGAASPNLVVLAVLLVSIYARREQALTWAVGVGLAQDLTSQQPLGLYAFSYGLLGLFVVGREAERHAAHPLSHFLMALGGALLSNLVVAFNEWAYPILHQLPRVRGVSLWPAVAGAAYTALLAPMVLAALLRVRGVFGLRQPRGGLSGG